MHRHKEVSWGFFVDSDEAEGDTVVKKGFMEEARFNCSIKVGAGYDGAHLCNPNTGSGSKRNRGSGHPWL